MSSSSRNKSTKKQPIDTTTPSSSSTTTTTEVPQSQPQSEIAGATAEGPPREKTAFDKAVDRDYNKAMEDEIEKGLRQIMERFVRMLAQEPNPNVFAVDALGHDTDFYENLMDAVRSGNPAAGSTREEVYLNLYNLPFTGMRSLEALKQQYSVQ